jgi:zinc protease
MFNEKLVRTTVDGVPCFSVDVGPPYAASLIFRVGHGDETFLQRGVSHFLEHLVLQSFRKSEQTVNGFVDMTTTTFHFGGDLDHLKHFLERLCSNLSAVPDDRIDVERRVLEAEAAQRPADPMASLLRARYGYRGPGLGGTFEWGLKWLQRDSLKAWASRWFSRSNAALVVVGPVPNDIHLDLPDGLEKEPWGLQPLPLHRPSFVAEGSGRVVLGIETRRGSFAPSIGLTVLREQMMDRLRHETGLVYDITPLYLRTGPDRAEASLAQTIRRNWWLKIPWRF